MKFYNREKEIKEMLGTQKRSLKSAQMTVVTGRRRIGKTQLLLKATEELSDYKIDYKALSMKDI